MKNHVIDNTIKNLGKTVLWQYDKAYRLLALLKHMQMLYHCAVTEFWDFWINKVLNIETCGAFGASMWGMFLGVPRPSVMNEDGTERLVATSVYRRILKGAFYLMKANSSYEDIRGYLEIVFGVMGKDNLSPWETTCSEYGWTTNDVNADGMTNGMWYLELIDSEGVVRKIGAAASDALSLSCSYKYGSKTITATATRTRKCGVTLTDNGDMSAEYGKSEWFDQMHKDQRDLFEQKKDEFLPYPLGVKTNEPVEQWVFGFSGDHVLEVADMKDGVRYPKGTLFKAEKVDWWTLKSIHLWRAKWDLTSAVQWGDEIETNCTDIGKYEYLKGYIDEGQENERYVAGTAYEKGHIFGYIDDTGSAFNYECLADISNYENTSFDSIKHKLRKTVDGDPFIGRLYSSPTPDIADKSVLDKYRGKITSHGLVVDNSISGGADGTDITISSKVVCLEKAIVKSGSMYRWNATTKNNDSMEGDGWSLSKDGYGYPVIVVQKAVEKIQYNANLAKDFYYGSIERSQSVASSFGVPPSDVIEFYNIDDLLSSIAEALEWKNTTKPGIVDDKHTDIASFWRGN